MRFCAAFAQQRAYLPFCFLLVFCEGAEKSEEKNTLMRDQCLLHDQPLYLKVAYTDGELYMTACLGALNALKCSNLHSMAHLSLPVILVLASIPSRS